MSQSRKVFLIGPGFLGYNVLEALTAEGYHVRVLVRRQDAVAGIKASGADVVMGDLDDTKVIAHHAFECDVVIHMATADHLPSVEAVLEGLVQRAEKELPSIYLHTSGAAVLDDGAGGDFKTEKIYTDEQPKEIDSLPDSAPHRNVDLAILKARDEIGRKAKIAIMVPPLVYGYVPKYGRLSIQIPYLARFALKNGFSGHIGKGISVTSTIHVRDLMTAYIAVLHHLEKTPGSSPDLHNPYYFIENTGDKEPSWLEIAEAIAEGLLQAGRLNDQKTRSIPDSLYGDLFGPATSFLLGLNSRNRADRLRELGWKPTHKDWRASLLEDELPVLLEE